MGSPYNQSPEIGERAAAGILLAIVLLSPLPFGSVLLRDRTLLAVAAWVALALVVVARRDLGNRGRAWVIALPMALLAGFAFLQAARWPEWWVALVGGRLSEVWSAAQAVVSSSSTQDSQWIPLSLAPRESIVAGLWWLALGAAFAAAVVVGSRRQHRRLLGLGIIVVSLIAVAYGADNFFRQGETLWGVRVPGDPGRLRGTFVNADHFAHFLAMPIAISVAWGWWALRRLTGSESLERRLVSLALPALAALTCFVALAFTGSRAGLLAVTLAVVAQGALLVVHYRRWQAGFVGLGALLLGMVGVLGFGLRQGLARWMETSAYEIAWNARLVVYRHSMELWADFPLLGTGLGTFEQAFGLVHPDNFPLRWRHAHSEVLELLVTAGLVGLPLVILGLVGLLRRLWVVFAEGRRSEDRAAGLAVLGAVIAALAHSLVDFGLSIPANGMILAILAGLAVGTSTLTAEEKRVLEEREEARRERRRQRSAARERRPTPTSPAEQA